MGSIHALHGQGTLQQPSSTKNIQRFIRRGNIFYDDRTHTLADDAEDTQVLDISNGSPERLISVAERSVLSQHFVNGTEESEASIVGVAKKPVEKPLSYGEFKAAVRRHAEQS